MAWFYSSTWEVRTTGNDLNGGGFIDGAGSGTDYSNQDSARATLTTASVVHSTTTQINVNAADYTVSAGDINNVVQLSGGAATAGFYHITAVDTVNNRWTLDKSAGTAGQTCTGRMGGALASLGKLGHAHILSNNLNQPKVWVKSGTYTLTTATDNVSGGPLNGANFNAGCVIEGYQTTRGDRAARPVFSAGSVTGITGLIKGFASRSTYVINIEYDANSGTGNTYGFPATVMYLLCVARNVSVAGARGFANGACFSCYAYNCSIGFEINTCPTYCLAESCNVGVSSVARNAYGTIAYNCTTGFNMSDMRAINCIAYGGTNGFNFTANNGGTGATINCVAMGCSAYGFNSTSAARCILSINCAGYNNATANFAFCIEEGTITLTGDPFVSAATKNFALNATAGAGAALKGAGYPATIPVF